MKKNLHIEILRSVALLFVIIYHIQILLGEQIFNNYYFNMLIKFGGEIGVTMFFIISGFCIFKSIDYKITKKQFNYKSYLKSRFLKIAIPYYFCLIVALTITGSASYLSKKGLFDIFTHLTFTHNFFVSTHGSINGALWTMGTFLQFYLIAPILYKYFKKNPNKTLLITFLVTICSKCIIYSTLNKLGVSGSYYFVYGRQLITALDNFAIGMYLSNFNKMIIKDKKINLSLLFVGIILVMLYIYFGSTKGIYSNTFIGYVYHSLFALLLAFDFKIYMNIDFNINNIINKLLLLIGKYEYEIYLWHFILIANVLGTGIFIFVRNISLLLCVLLSLIVSITFGIVISKYHKSN